MARVGTAAAISVFFLSACGPQLARTDFPNPPPNPVRPQTLSTGRIATLTTIAGQPIQHLTADVFDQPIALMAGTAPTLVKLDSSQRPLWQIDLSSMNASPGDFVRARDAQGALEWFSSSASASQVTRFDGSGATPSSLVQVQSGWVMLAANGAGDLTGAVPSEATIQGIDGALFARYANGASWSIPRSSALQFLNAALLTNGTAAGAHVFTQSPFAPTATAPRDAGFYVFGFDTTGANRWARKLPSTTTDILAMTSNGDRTAALVSIAEGSFEFGPSSLTTDAAAAAVVVIDNNGNPLWASLLPRSSNRWTIAIGADGSVAAATNECGVSTVVSFSAAGSEQFARRFGGNGCASMSITGIEVTAAGPLVGGGYQGRVDFGDNTIVDSLAPSGFLMQMEQ